MIYLAILLSAIMYRMPRGGGLGEGRSSLGSAIWALLTGVLFAVSLNTWYGLLVGPLLFLGDAPGWSRWWPTGKNPSVIYLSLRGLLLLNPFMGVIYFGFHRWRHKLPRYGRFIDGWTAYSELACGLVTATAWALVLIWFARIPAFVCAFVFHGHALVIYWPGSVP